MFWLLLQIITIVTPLMAGVYWLAGNSYVKMALCFCSAIAIIVVNLLIELKIISDDMSELNNELRALSINEKKHETKENDK